jgi:hypothetical protein
LPLEIWQIVQVRKILAEVVTFLVLFPLQILLTPPNIHLF